MEEDERGKLFVGGLSWETTQENLQRYFSRYGEIIDCVVMKNNETGRSRGFGFVTFADPNNMNHVLQSGPHNLDGRTIDPKPCNPRTLQKPRKGGGYKIFLGGLPSNITETDLRTFFGRYGKVTEVVIMYDQEKKKSRGFGFLSFEDEGSVDCVTNERYINLNGKQVEIKKAEPRDGISGGSSSGIGGGGGGGGGGSTGGIGGGGGGGGVGGGYNKMGNDSQWGHHQGTPMGMMQGPNGQMGGPPMNMPMGGPNMMQGYQSWGTSPQQQGYGYGTSSGPGSYQAWGAPPAPQGPPPQWSNYGGPQQAQGYGSYDMYSSTSVPAGPTASNAANWSSWNVPPAANNAGGGGSGAGGAAGTGADMYSRPQQTWTGSQSGTAPVGGGGGGGMPRSGPGNSASKSGSEYDYSGYGSAYDYDYMTYSKDQATNFVPRTAYGADTNSQPPFPPTQAV